MFISNAIAEQQLYLLHWEDKISDLTQQVREVMEERNRTRGMLRYLQAKMIDRGEQEQQLSSQDPYFHQNRFFEFEI